MNELSIAMTVVSGIIAILSITFAILNYAKNHNKDSSKNEGRMVSIEKDIQYIRMSTDAILKTVTSHEQRIVKLENRRHYKKEVV